MIETRAGHPSAVGVGAFLLASLLVVSSVSATAISAISSSGSSFSSSGRGLSEETPQAKSKVPTRPQKPPRRVAAAHVLISYRGAPRAYRGVTRSTRSRDDARKRAEEVVAHARRPEATWDDVVKKFSDDPGGAESSGLISIFDGGKLQGPFQAMGDALFAMEIGQVSDVVESPYGYHVLSRLTIVEYSASHILIRYKGSERARPNMTRTKDEARKLAEQVLADARQEGADFTALARKHSDESSASRGGFLGIFSAGVMAVEFDRALASMKIGEINGPVETPFGFHIIRRDKIERVGARQILISYQGAQGAAPTITRSKKEAKKLAGTVLAEARKEGADFAALAKKHSDDPTGAEGGDLGFFGKGDMMKPFEEAAFSLEVGGLAGLVETPFGFHIILRTD